MQLPLFRVAVLRNNCDRPLAVSSGYGIEWTLEDTAAITKIGAAALMDWVKEIRPASCTLLIALALALSGCADNSDPPGPTYTLSATISGLDVSGLMLVVNGTEIDVPAGTTTLVLPALLPPGSAYSVTVVTQPTGHTCSVAGGSGTIGSANVANIVVTCSDQAYTLGGSISGLGNNSGLVLANGSDTLTVSPGATSFVMPTPVAYTSSYDVIVQNQPAGLACSVSNGSSTMPAAPVTNITISCTDQPFTLGGTISGLGSNSGLVLANGTDTLTVLAGSTSFTMPTRVSFGSAYSVGVQSSPAGLTCTPSNAAGTMPAANVTNVLITCSDQSYSLGGSISGLISSGLVLANGTDTLTVSSGAGNFTMPTDVAYGSSFDVTVQTQPSGLTCTPSNNVGTMPAGSVTSVAITCAANTYTVGGTISGLSTSGLVLLDNGVDATTINSNATLFTMNTGVAYGSPYAVTVQSEPTGLVCPVSNGSGTMGAADVTTVSLACVSNFTLLYSFAGGSGDGKNPYHSLIQASDGNFYGTTLYGGTSNGGIIFEITPSGTESVFYTFAAGSGPYSGLMQASDDNFYGTTSYGGASHAGTFFEITPTGTESLLYTFPSGSSNPYTGVIQGIDGNFYGTTGAGGTSDDGTVFKLTPSWTKTALHVFPKTTSSDGQIPYAGLIQGIDGNFYGTTYFGGTSDYGTVFKVTPTGTETVLYSFAGGSDGEHPYAGVVQGTDGNFYGTTYQGGTNGLGTVYKITASGTETVLYSFAGGSSDGSNPEAGLIQATDGNFYGMTYQGGASNDGTVFKITASGTESILHSFAGSDGANPWANLVQSSSDGNLYGSTYAGGTSGYGTFFKVALH
jgi:uncharacterized repeat protein (TIGR03803 family)